MSSDAPRPGPDASPREVFSGIAILSRHALRANGQVGSFTREIRRQSAGVDRAIAATRGSVGRDTAVATADGLRHELVDAVTHATTAITSEMGQIATRIDVKATEASRLVKVIDRIGATIKILSLNASIEAASAGEHGRGFAVIASEVRALANETLESARDAAAAIDFSDVRAELAALQTSIDRVHGALAGSVRHTADRVEDLLEGVGGELAVIADSNASIDEALNAMQTSIDRADGKTRRCLGLSEQSRDAPDGARTLPDVVDHGIARRSLPHDLLDEIIDRGYIRIAIDPALKGLSFRQRAGAPLVGLDVEYAGAFAKFLGVAPRFVECPWDECTELLWAGRAADELPADIVWSGLPPHADFGAVAYSMPYSYITYVLTRRMSDTRIAGIGSLEGRKLGIINDPTAFATLRAAGVRWAENLDIDGRAVATLGSLNAFTDQSRIYDALAEGLLDACMVDAPVMYWACVGADSPWRGRLEIIPGNIASAPFYYAAGVADHPSSCRLLMAADAFIDAFTGSPVREAIERQWQGGAIIGSRTYRDEDGSLRGAKELCADYRTMTRQDPTLSQTILSRGHTYEAPYKVAACG